MYNRQAGYFYTSLAPHPASRPVSGWVYVSGAWPVLRAAAHTLPYSATMARPAYAGGPALPPSPWTAIRQSTMWCGHAHPSGVFASQSRSPLVSGSEDSDREPEPRSGWRSTVGSCAPEGGPAQRPQRRPRHASRGALATPLPSTPRPRSRGVSATRPSLRSHITILLG